MPSFVFLTTVLSLDVTRILVTNGYGLGFDTDAATSAGAGRFTGANAPGGSPYPPLSIVGCTGNGVSPIVVTTQYPHNVSSRGIGGIACIISGVGGNDAANNISTDPLDRTVGLNQGVLAKPLTANTLALYAQDQGRGATGRIFPIMGNGAWSGGGTVTPALTAGQILLGRANVNEHAAPPRIVLVPRTIGIGPDDISSPNAFRVVERRAEIAQRSLGTDACSFDVHCWGQRLPGPDAAYDFDIALALAQAVKGSAYLLFGQSEQAGQGTWDDAKERELQLIKAGQLFTFSLTVDVPVLDSSLGFVPSGTTMQSVVQSPTPETAATVSKILS